MVHALRDPDPDVRRLASLLAEVLGPATPGLVPTLCAALQDDDVGVRRQALCTLHELGPSAWPGTAVLADALRNDDADVRRLAMRALLIARSGRDAEVSLEGTWVVATAAATDGRVLAALVEALQDGDPRSAPSGGGSAGADRRGERARRSAPWSMHCKTGTAWFAGKPFRRSATSARTACRAFRR